MEPMTTDVVLAQPHHSGVAERTVNGTVIMSRDELVVRVRPDDHRDATTRPVVRVDPTTLSGIGSMRLVGSCVGADAMEVYRAVAFCRRHPVLAWLRGWRW